MFYFLLKKVYNAGRIHQQRREYMPFKKSSRPSIPTSRNNDLYSIDQSLLNFSRNYEPDRNVSCGHSTLSSHSVSGASSRLANNVDKKK